MKSWSVKSFIDRLKKKQKDSLNHCPEEILIENTFSSKIQNEMSHSETHNCKFKGQHGK